MTRDDEIYELAKEDRRVFFPGSHASILEAVRVLLADGFSARWEERGETLRNRMGWDERSAFVPVHTAIIDALGYGVWMGLSHPAQSMFSFTRYGVDIPNTLQWAANDMGRAAQVDAAREKGLVTKEGVAYAAHGNPFECLLRIAYSGILVEKVTPERVVLVVVED
jgi:hypothetical protein